MEFLVAKVMATSVLSPENEGFNAIVNTLGISIRTISRQRETF
jgi:hypothetical protein